MPITNNPDFLGSFPFMTIKTLFLSTTLAALIIVAAASSTLASDHEHDHAAPASTAIAPAIPAEDAKKADDHKDHDKDDHDEDSKKKD
jgi:hypothetical protein